MSLSPDTWLALCRQLAGAAPQVPAFEIPGRVHRIADMPLQPADLIEVTSPSELALLTGCSRQLAAYHIGRGDPAGALRKPHAAQRTPAAAPRKGPPPRKPKAPKHDARSRALSRRIAGARG